MLDNNKPRDFFNFQNHEGIFVVRPYIRGFSVIYPKFMLKLYITIEGLVLSFKTQNKGEKIEQL